jgi:hypothetical protein
LLLEPAIAARYQKVTGREVLKLDDYHVEVMDGALHLFCTPDRLVRIPMVEKPWPLQLKSSAYFDPKEELPVHWQIQEQHEMMVLGASGASFAILIAGRRFHHCDVARNDVFIAFMRERLDEFWDHVQRGSPPDPDGHRATTEALKRLYPTESGTAVELPTDALAWREDLDAIKEQIKHLKLREAAIENQLRGLIADHSFGYFDDGSGFSLKVTKRAAYSVDACEYRTLRPVKTVPKGLLKQ